MLWNIIPLIFGAVASLIANILEYKPFDRRTKRFALVVRSLMGIILLAYISSIIGIWMNERSDEIEKRALTDRLDAIRHAAASTALREKKNNTILLHEVRDLKRQLKPFEQLALERYPSLPIAKAFRQLQADLKDIKTKTTQIERRTSPRQLSNTDRKKALSILREARNARVTILVPMGDQEALQFAHQIADCMREAGWQVDDLLNSIFPNPATGAEIRTREGIVTPSVKVITRVMGLVGGNPRFFKNPSASEGVVELVIGAKE